MPIYLDHTKNHFLKGTISVSGSKSESNRLLILQQHYPSLEIENLSNADDTRLLTRALSNPSKTIDIGHAGTAMRFLTAYFAVQKGIEKILTGSERMKDRPIKILVNALQQIDSRITYVDKIGYPPLLIHGKEITKNKITIQADVSSQYISALLLIAPFLKNGLILTLKGTITSTPYIQMTLSLLKELDINTSFKDNTIKVLPFTPNSVLPKKIWVEPDWSSASYYYSLVALHKEGELILNGFKENSLQGDRIVSELYKKLGVKTTFMATGIVLTAFPIASTKKLEFDLIEHPDLAQTIIVTCMGLGIDCQIKGVHTLKIKETDRLVALKNELEKFGATVNITDDSITLSATAILPKNIQINTYQDHRMAMAFAPLSVRTPLFIEHPEVVSKSYPDFWKDWGSLFD